MAKPQSRWQKPGWRFLRRLVLWPLLAVIAYWVLALALYRSVLPPATPLMIIRSIAAKDLVSYRPTPLTDINHNLTKAVIASEDARFCLHDGIDFNAISDALEDYEQRGRLRGASTITMQVSRNIFLWNGGGAFRKILEVPLALLLDAVWSKRRIIEVYLNIAEWGDGTFGAEAAAKRYFQKSAKNLTAAEASRLSAILPNPIRWNAARPTRYIQSRSSIIQRRISQLDKSQIRCINL